MDDKRLHVKQTAETYLLESKLQDYSNRNITYNAKKS